MTQETASFLPAPISDETFEALTHCFRYDECIPLEARVVASMPFTKAFELCVDLHDPENGVHHTREKIVFTGRLGVRVPGYLAIPSDATGPLPCVVVIDGIGGSKDRWWEHDSWPRGPLALKSLLDAGYAVLAIDAQYHGERSADNDFDLPSSLIWGGIPRMNSFVGAVVESTVECYVCVQ